MLVEDFKAMYTNIPFTTFSRDHKKNTPLLDSGALLHIHKEMEVICVLDGKAKFYIDSVAYEICKGDIVVVSPYMPHRSKILSEYDFKHYCVCFDLDLLYDQKLKNALQDGTKVVLNIIKNNPELCAFINNSFYAHKEKFSGWEFEVIGNISLFMGKLQQNGYIIPSSAPLQKNIYRKVIDYIRDNYNNDITSLDAANKLHINSSYFCRTFKKNFGYTFQNYLCMYRVQISKSLLADTDISISQIANKIGFNSISYYIKRFKEFNGITPTQYRTLHKK